MLIKVSKGALQNNKAFLTRKRRRDEVRSANSPKMKVSVVNARPIMVRNMKCQP